MKIYERMGFRARLILQAILMTTVSLGAASLFGARQALVSTTGTEF